jgi:hypothetical protein
MTERRTARSDLDVMDAEIEIMGYTRSDRDRWEQERDELMLSMAEKDFSLSLIARASGFAVSRVSDYVRRARERRSST